MYKWICGRGLSKASGRNNKKEGNLDREYIFSSYALAELSKQVELLITKFYKILSNKAKDEGVINLFKTLARQEQVHVDHFHKIAVFFQDNDQNVEYSIDIEGILHQRIDKIKTMLDHYENIDHMCQQQVLL